MIKHLAALIICLCLVTISCVPPTKKTAENATIDFNDPIVQKILNAQVEHNLDTIYKYLSNPNDLYREMAVNAIATLGDSGTTAKVIPLLNDNTLAVRAAAAYAVGQLGDSTYVSELINSFRGQDTISINNIFNHNVLEAVGKIGSNKDAELIAGVQTYRDNDTLLLQGQTKGLYRFALRNIVPEASIKLALSYLERRNIDNETRLYAAHILARPRSINLTPYADKIMTIISGSSNPDINMALVSALGKAKTDPAKNFLITKALGTSDERIRANAVRALTNFIDMPGVVDTLMPLLSDNSTFVAVNTADLMLKVADYSKYPAFKNQVAIIPNWLVRAKIMQAQMKNTALLYTVPKNQLKDTVLTMIKASSNNFEKAELIKVLGHDPYQYLNIINLPASSSNEKIAKIEALQMIITHPEFIRAYKANYIKVKREILYYIAAQMKEGDSGLVSVAAAILATPTTEAKILLRDSTLIEAVLAKLKNPQDIEAINEVGKLNQYLYAVPYVAATPPKRKPIDFTKLAIYGDSIEVVMKTSKGNVNFILWPKHAPQTVSTFIALAESDYYDNKYFHRVVPNFVAQGGCPRGDGYGSADFLINSELNQKYYNTAGLLNMASAGNHTESTQFCFMHSPAPHLDGKYTIFGQISQGQDIADKLKIGDKIIDIVIKK